MGRLVGWRGWEGGEQDKWIPVGVTDDNKLLVDASVTLSNADGAITDGADSSLKASVIDTSAPVLPLAVRLTDDSGDYVAGSGGGAATVADGADVAEGSTTDAAVGDSDGTVNAHLRQVAKVLSDIWDNANNRIAVFVDNTSVAVTGPLTDTQLRASAVPVSLASVPSHAVTNAGTFAVQAAQSGTWNITNVSGTVSLPTGAATSAAQTDGSQKTKIVDGSGNVIGATSNALDVNIKSGNPTTIAVTNAGTFAVQEATLDAALISQEANTSGIKGMTAFGAVTTAAPTYTTAKSDALSLTTGGALRSDITTIAGTAPTTVGKLDIKSADGDISTLGVTTGTAVVTDATGTVQQYLRGLIKNLAAGTWTVLLGATSALIGYVGVKPTYAAKATMTWTGTSLANGSARESTVVDNTSNRYRDVRIRFQTKGQSSGTAYCDIYVYTALGDTTYTDAATGTDAAFTAANRFNSRYLGSIKCNAATSAVQCEFLLSDVFATCPDKWGLIIINNTGATLSATAGDHVLEYEGVN